MSPAWYSFGQCKHKTIPDIRGRGHSLHPLNLGFKAKSERKGNVDTERPGLSGTIFNMYP